jgi:2-polyprenyl-3-methyl-5-hydroxy-6-metoxy-1,4-benzoquinol methylase
MIDVKDIIDKFNIDEHNKLADAYFATVKDDSPLLNKPFVDVGSAPTMLQKLSLILDGARLFPGARVCDFGAGMGWLTRVLAQLGCEAHALDVSANALALADLHISSKYPEARKRCQFHKFDSRKIEFDDNYFDRILCFDAFHHVSNQREILSEMYRTLTPGGVASFVEPGPFHSITPASQHEMMTYGVIENDIIIENIWAEASAIGFKKIEIAAFFPQRLAFSIEEFNSLRDLNGAPDSVRLSIVRALAALQRNYRFFVLIKDPDFLVDGRYRGGLAGKIDLAITNSESGIIASCNIINVGRVAWLPSGSGRGSVNLGISGVRRDGSVQHLRRVMISDGLVKPGAILSLPPFVLPKSEEFETYRLDLVSELVAWFSNIGGDVVDIRQA